MNKSILLAAGSVIKTITPEKTLIAIANISQEIPADACIYDLSRFLSILSLYNDPDVEFFDKYFIISEGKRRTKYVFADLSMIHTPPEKEIVIPTADVVVDVTADTLSSVLKAAGVLQFSEIAFVGEGGKCYLKAIDNNADDFGVEIGETVDEFRIIIKTDNLKLMPIDYEVTLCSKGISQFKGKGVTYYVAIDSKSTYNKR